MCTILHLSLSLGPFDRRFLAADLINGYMEGHSRLSRFLCHIHGVTLPVLGCESSSHLGTVLTDFSGESRVSLVGHNYLLPSATQLHRQAVKRF